jgi:hypothetical protein
MHRKWPKNEFNQWLLPQLAVDSRSLGQYAAAAEPRRSRRTVIVPNPGDGFSLTGQFVFVRRLRR